MANFYDLGPLSTGGSTVNAIISNIQLLNNLFSPINTRASSTFVEMFVGPPGIVGGYRAHPSIIDEKPFVINSLNVGTKTQDPFRSSNQKYWTIPDVVDMYIYMSNQIGYGGQLWVPEKFPTHSKSTNLSPAVSECVIPDGPPNAFQLRYGDMSDVSNDLEYNSADVEINTNLDDDTGEQLSLINI